jgi:hippurate hydrolase
MPVVNSLAEGAGEIAEWRRDLHRHPELLYEVHRTAAVVAERLRGFGLDEVVTGIGRTGVVGVLRGRNPGRTLALRADMDALPITEASGAPWTSETPGLMHACGHDGHTAMLLGAARQLAETRAFDGTAVFIFQPAEEGGAGAKAMIDDGLLDRFGIDEVYGMHNMPGLPLRHFAVRPGPFMAAVDTVHITVRGHGAHAAKPHEGVDPVLVGAHIVTALHAIVSRTLDPIDSGVISVTCFNAGTTDNVIPETAELVGSVRSLSAKVRDTLERRIGEVAAGVAAAFGATAEVDYRRVYPVTVNEAGATAYAAAVARDVAGVAAVDDAAPPLLGAEDFSFMLEARPGAMIFIGNGDSAGLHQPGYDFNDAAIPYGASYWTRIVEMRGR